MNTGTAITNLLTQLLSQLPMLLVYLTGLVLALVFWRRCPTPCLFVLLATALFLLVTVAHSFVFHHLIQAKTEMDWPPEKFDRMIRAVGLASNCLRAAALGLLLTAVFVRRGVPPSAGQQ